MRAPGIPADEAERLAALYDYGILDTPAERIFDEVAQLAATICGTELAAITLIDRDRQWFKAEHGRSFGETSRDESICGHAILQRDIFVIPDTARDDRFAGNPLLSGTPEIRFYGGSQLMTESGHAIGMLCVMDAKPRELSPQQQVALTQLANVVMAVIDAGRKTRVAHWFGSLLDTVHDEILIIDPDSLVYLHANRAAQENLGFTLEEMRHLTPMEVTNDPDRPKFESFVRRLRAGEPFVSFEGVRKRPGTGELYPVEARWQLLQTHAQPVVLSIVQDVTERRKIERMKDEFISVVNHELRTPLTSIHGALKLLTDGAGGELPPHASYLVQLAAQNTQRLRGIIDDILDLEKIASGRMEFQLEPQQVRGLLERVAQAYEASAQAAQVTLSVNADPALQVMADGRRLHQVLANLLSNAIRFAPAGSTVVLSGAPLSQGRTRLAVTDEGAGIPEEFRSRVFQRFAQAEMGTRRAQGGSGLGLAISRDMVQGMGGEISFESRPGRTSFRVDLQSPPSPQEPA